MAAIIGSIAKTILPYAASFLISGIKGVAGGLDDDLAGTNVMPSNATRLLSLIPPHLRILNSKIIGNLDSPLDDKDKKSEECLVVTNDEISRRQALEAMFEQARIEHLVLGMPVEGLKKSEVTVTATYAFQFGPKLLTNEKPDIPEENITYVQPGDHVSFQLTPRLYNNFTQLTRHELVKFRTCRITSQLTSAYDSTTIVGYIPFVKNTKDINNYILGMLTKRVNLQPAEPLDFTVRYVSPALVEYNKTTNTWTPADMYLEPNKIVRADYIKHLYNEEKNTNTMFSYGTVIILKENTGESTISCKYKVEMTFDVWDYIDIAMDLEHAQEQWDEEHKTDGSGSGSSPSTGASRRRRAGN